MRIIQINTQNNTEFKALPKRFATFNPQESKKIVPKIITPKWAQHIKKFKREQKIKWVEAIKSAKDVFISKTT